VLLLGPSLVILAQTDPVQLTNPLKGQNDISAIIGGIIKWVLRFMGVLALVMFIYGGMLWMTSGGKSEQITKGKDTLVWAIAGLALVFFSYAILTFVFKVLGTD
jgi:hypothetical protein